MSQTTLWHSGRDSSCSCCTVLTHPKLVYVTGMKEKALLFASGVLLLSGCKSAAQHARHDLVGLTRPELISCAGVPDAREDRDGQEVLVWKQDQNVDGGVSVSTPFLIGLSIAGRGTCHFVATIRDGKVRRISYTGPSQTLYGPLAACEPLVRDCEAYIRTERTQTQPTVAPSG
ncbi:hypothetical protein [Acetobacter indonesiensis]|nr:hypothetical protein [Acetobacter indonesiensis]